MVGLDAVFLRRRPELLLVSPDQPFCTLFLGIPCDPPLIPQIQPGDRIKAELDRQFYRDLPVLDLDAAAGLSSRYGDEHAGDQPYLPVLDTYRGHSPAAPLDRTGLQYSLPPQGASCIRYQIPGQEPCGGAHYLGPDVWHLYAGGRTTYLRPYQ